MKKKVLVVGDVLVDQYVRGDLVAPDAPTLAVRHKDRAPGGAANVAANALAQGVPVGVIGFRGQSTDGWGDWLASRLTALGIWHSLLPAAYADVQVRTNFTSDGRTLFRCDEGLNLSPAAATPRTNYLGEAVEAVIHEVGVLVLADCGRGTLTKSTANRLINLAAERGVPVVVDPHGDWLAKYPPENAATAIVANWREALDFIEPCLQAPEGDPLTAHGVAERIARKMQVRNVIITCGAKGAHWLDATDPVPSKWSHHRVSASARAVFDGTGAGDTFVATLAAEMLRGTPMAEAVVRANAAAGVAVSKPGTATVTRTEVEEELLWKKRGVQKVVDVQRAGRIAARRRNDGQKVGFLWGEYHRLKPGHVRFLNRSREDCDFLVAGVLEDPADPEDLAVPEMLGAYQLLADRLEVLSATEAVDLVVPLPGNHVTAVVREVRPDVLFVTDRHSYGPVATFVADHGGRVVTLPRL